MSSKADEQSKRGERLVSAKRIGKIGFAMKNITASANPDLTSKQLQEEIHQNYVNIVHSRYFHLYNYRLHGVTDPFNAHLRKSTKRAVTRFFAKRFPTTLRYVKLIAGYDELDDVYSTTAFTGHLEDMDGERLWVSLDERLEDQAAYKLEILYAYRVEGKRMTKSFINYCLKESGYVLA